MTPAPTDLSIAEAGVALRNGTLSSTALTRACLARIARRDPAIGAFVHLDRDAALAAAKAADTAFGEGRDLGVMQGIPFAIKDIIDVAGWPVRWGSRSAADRVADTTAPCVQTLLAAGAVPLGLVATYELATVGPDAAALYPQPRNPWNAAHVTGGSSSGSAAAVAAGMVRVALGTDTGGSVRSPSSYCGTVGLKPTFGALSLAEVMPLAPSLDHLGVIGRTVGDTAAVFAVLAGRQAPGDGLRVAYGRDWCDDAAAHPLLATLMDDAAAALSLVGAVVTITDMPPYGGVEAAASAIILSEEFASHGASIANNVGPMAAASIGSGGEVSNAAVRQAQAFGADFATQIDRILTDQDVLILPTTMAPAPPFSAFEQGVATWTAMRTIPFNVTGHPALSLPMGFADGLPMGLQIVGRHGDEAAVLRIGAALEAATDHGALTPYFAPSDT